MNNDELRGLCLSLVRTDSEDEVISLLMAAGLWENQKAWRYYGDNENNFSTIGNQQSRPDAALVEKLINSVDARLINECLSRGIDPEGSDAPKAIQHAVGAFFDESIRPGSQTAGRLTEWPLSKRTEVSRGITLAATGFSPKDGKPCFTIADCGEGQSPETMPLTLLSLNKSNKLRIPFVQGKFNMGSTGVLSFCGRHNLQLIVSRRNPALLADNTDPSSFDWGFTIVRREDPGRGRRSSVYTYLAPVNSETYPGHGGVLGFSASEMPIFPDGRDAYGRNSNWGTLIKLYEYSSAGMYSNTHILRKDGLLSRLDLLLPDIALPIRLHECRSSFRGHEGSFETTLTGLRVRLEDDRSRNLEIDFPSSSPLSALDEEMKATIYAFRKDRADTYRKNEGIIFVLNGQTHGYLTKDFFTRKNAGRLNYIADSVLVIVDCSKFSGRAREDLFMNSRDRLRNCELRSQIEHELEDLLREHSGLRALRERRRREEVEAKLDDAKPLESILENLLKQSPTLSALFLEGLRMPSNPFKTSGVWEGEGSFNGRKYPTYFRFKGKDNGFELQRDCPSNRRVRVVFETDVANEYFDRDIDQGEFSLFVVQNGTRKPVATYVGPNLHNGHAKLSVQLPTECAEGDMVTFLAAVTDRSRLSPFENTLRVSVLAPVEVKDELSKSKQRNSPLKSQQSSEREMPSGISLPNVIEVFESEWENKSPHFDQYTAMRVSVSDTDDGTGNKRDVYDFFVNMDNFYLKSELKSGSQEIEVLKARWKYGLVLVGIALLHQNNQSKGASKNGEDKEKNDDGIEAKIDYFTKGVAPVILPMISSLGGLDLESFSFANSSGEAT